MLTSAVRFSIFPGMPARRLALVLISLGALLVIVLVFTDLVTVLRGPAPGTGEWYWPYLLRPAIRWWPALLTSGGILLLVARWLARPADHRRANRAAQAGLVVGSLLLQLALVYADRPQVEAELIDRTLSVRTSGHFWTAAQIADPGPVLRDFPAEMPAFESEHSRTHPPGLLMANWATIALMARLPALAQPLAEQVWPLRCLDLWLLEQPPGVPAALAIWSVLPLVAAALAVLPAFALARRLFDPDAARLAAAAVATMPAVLLFATQSDQLFVLLTMLIALTLYDALHRESALLFFLTGLLLSLSSFLSIGNAALLLPVMLFAGLWQWRGPAAGEGGRWREWLKWTAALLAGGLLVWGLFQLIWGVTPWSIALTAVRQHYELVTSRRVYSWWLLYNQVDLLIFVGLPWLVGFVWLIVRSARAGLRDAAGRLAVVLLVLLLALTIAGSTRGEGGRLWLFLTPLIALLGAGMLAGRFPRRAQRLLLLALQLLLVLALGFAWRTIEAVIVVAQEPLLPEPAGVLQSVNQRFGESLLLQSYALEQNAAPPRLDLTLVWTTSDTVVRPYTVFNHLLDSDGAIIAQHDGWPVQGQWPPTCWHPGDVIVDRHTIMLPTALEPGAYRLVTGLYDATAGDRLTTGSGAEYYLLETLQLPE